MTFDVRKIFSATAIAGIVAATPLVAQEIWGDWDTDADAQWTQEEFGAGFGEQDAFGGWDANQDNMIDEDEFNQGVFGGYDANDDEFLDEEEQGMFGEDWEGGLWGDNEM